MLQETVFNETFLEITNYYNQALSPRISRIYYEYFSKNLSDQEFMDADDSIMVPRKDSELINAKDSELFRSELKPGDKVEFYNQDIRKKWVGTIKSIKL
ncbi:MAG: hypothetical protein HWQ23_15065 [Nostoc sp. JL33]|uniref:hypothetical protein n=1 Tax=Nostoc sp. JL33 TaxID=2815396 RepID=UPI0025EF4EC3|nr:hypothetical protein [Nostoc sp. JL33]MBN3871544.1 hypothetical protein [Nostoc sp. JL33]